MPPLPASPLGYVFRQCHLAWTLIPRSSRPELQLCSTMPGLYGAGDREQAFVIAGQSKHCTNIMLCPQLKKRNSNIDMYVHACMYVWYVLMLRHGFTLQGL